VDAEVLPNAAPGSPRAKSRTVLLVAEAVAAKPVGKVMASALANGVVRFRTPRNAVDDEFMVSPVNED
jgi:hypothetical protein